MRRLLFRVMLRAVRLAAVLAALAAPLRAGAEGCLLCGDSGPAAADCGATGGGVTGGGAGTPIEIEMQAGFNFRRLSLPGGRGDVLVEADGTAVGAGGGYALVGQVVVRGAPGAAISIELPRTIVLTSRGGGRIELADIRSTLPRTTRLDANGRIEFGFSAPLSLPAGASPGDYRASFSIDANYD
jgi:Domain of unknown function (DUF4402)